MEYPLKQSAWRRGWNDTKTVWTNWLFFILDAVVGVVIGSLFQWYWGVGIVLFGMLCAWLAVTISAPVRQRNETRRLLSEMPSKRKVIANKLGELYISGRELSIRIADDNFKGDAISLVQGWSKPLMDFCYSEPDILGKSAIVRLSPRSSDWGIFGTNKLADDKEKDYAFRHLSILLEKLLDMVQEYDK